MRRGKGGLYIILFLIVALIIAYLAATQMQSIRSETSSITEQVNGEGDEDLVQETQDLVDILNQKMGK